MRYQVQVEELDNTLVDCGSPYSTKREATRIAKHLAKNCPQGATNYLVFDNRADIFVFTTRV